MTNKILSKEQLDEVTNRITYLVDRVEEPMFTTPAMTIEVVNLCASLLESHKALEGELDYLKKIFPHAPKCRKGQRTDEYMIAPCTCGRDKLIIFSEQS